MTTNPQTLPLGERLVRLGLVTEDQLQVALIEQRNRQARLGEVLVQLGFVSEQALQELLAETLGSKAFDFSGFVPDARALQAVPKYLAQTQQVFPISYEADEKLLVLASNRPGNLLVVDQLRASIGSDLNIEWRLANPADVIAAIDQYYGFDFSIEGILKEIETGELDMTSLARGQAGYSHPVVRLVDMLLADAVNRGASDLHFEPEGSILRVRYRIDGVMRQIRALHIKYWPAMLVRFKLISGMNIAENRAPQDGRCNVTVSGRLVDFRVAIHPTIHGENLVLRVLDAKKSIVPYDQLGLSPQQYHILNLMLARPEGVILVTGPTGSGKTTTLYSILNHLNREEVNIMTIEDPVEYPLMRIRQTSVSDGTKIDFGSGIRSLMRQDPDIILVGEIRDPETAEMAIRAAMTGHQVFSTLHTNSALRSFTRLRNLGVSADLMAGHISGVIAQRLVRRVCPSCREPVQLHEGMPEWQLLGPQHQGQTIFRARRGGCPSCNHTGYRGRMAIMELLRVDSGMDELLARSATLGELAHYARQRGFQPLAFDGLRRVLEGLTTIDEVGRVTDLTALLDEAPAPSHSG
ncbi:MAG: ATPase, T2SS/T4P/T4SS family [Tepidimonas sp.]|uniref:GspE/PulE family protein n=1 Tax=Tepidimonas sp. TaxID=2002775 RepID=UPI00259EF49B|nr:type II/IV secretion system protein [Tepidimonas sp.]MDM7457722.1 ATPase, T2SS/T4P/T4SS family [Tepidimonas sp.]